MVKCTDIKIELGGFIQVVIRVAQGVECSRFGHQSLEFYTINTIAL